MIGTVTVAFLKRGAREALSYRAAFLLRVAGLVMTLASLFYFSRLVDAGSPPWLTRYGGNYLSFGLAGLVLLNLQHAVLASYPTTIRAAQLAGTLEAMLTTPTPSWMVLLCAPTYQISAAMMGATAALLAAGFLLGVQVPPGNWPALLAALVLCPLAFASFGFFAATLTMMLRRSDPLTMFMGGVSALAGGVFYPTGVLPGWLRAVGQLLPITHALEMVRMAAFAGASPSTFAPGLLGLVVTCALAVPLGLASFMWAVHRARRNGSLSHY